MKQLLLLLITIVPLLTSAQDYQTVRSDFIHFFLDENGKGHGMRMDSVAVEGADSILINYLTLRFIDYEFIDAYVPSWLGAKTVIKPNGDNLFFNAEGDTILIKTQAQLSDNWNLYKLDSASYLEATISTIATETIIDSQVEVKTISLQRKDYSNNSLGHPLNGKTIKISNLLGIIQGFDFHLFPEDTIQIEIAGMENPNIGIHRLTRAEVYDFQVGDEFHYKREDGDPLLERRIQIVTSVSNEPDERTIEFDVYKLDMWFNGTPGPQTQMFESTFETTVENYSNLSSRIVVMPSEASVFDTTYLATVGLDLIVEGIDSKAIDQHSSGRLAGYLHNSNSAYTQDSLGLWYEYPTVSGGTSTTKKFASGIGRTYWRYWSSDGLNWTEQEESLVYFKKGTEEWGTPYSMSLITGIEESFLVKTKIYPNPVRLGKTIDLGNSYQQIELFDMSGRSILIEHNQKRLQTENLKVGMYILRLTNSEGTNTQRLVITNP